MRLITIVLVVTFLLFSALMVEAVNKTVSSLPKPNSGQSIDTDTRIDANNIDMFVTNIGSFAWDLQTGEAGLIFPKGTNKTAVYASGLWVGAKVSGQIRVMISEYSQEYVPGIMKDSTYVPDEPRFKVYKIKTGDDFGNNPDYANWPSQDGAPLDSLGYPLLLGNQTLWCVYNDADPAAHTNDAGSTAPLGLEVQQTTFAYNQEGALGNTIFMKFKLINKGPKFLDSTYVALWSDPDLGGAADDLVGCDTLLSLGYCYNATNNDQLYDGTPPAVGYDFFQGPIVYTGNSADTGKLNDIPRPGYKNLPMTAFNKYINGTDPRNYIQSYQYMKGLDAVVGFGAPYTNPITGDTTTFVLTGDPVAGTGWLDANPSDRRLMLCSGPFTMAPGDTQEVVIGIIIGQGTDRLNSISLLKQSDIEAQKVFESNFKLPSVPSPTLYTRGFNQAVDLVWTREADGFVDTFFTKEFHHEGYNIYQGESANGPWEKIATYDVIDSVTYIYADVYNPEIGAYERILTQRGTNSGLNSHLYIDYDYLENRPLFNDSSYYYAVTAYSYDSKHGTPYYILGYLVGYIIETIESPIVAVECIPRSSTPYHLSDTAVHISGISGGMVIVEYLDQSKITNHTYKVTFNSDRTWNLIDTTLNLTLLSNQFNQTGDYNYPIVDGMMVRVIGPAPGFNMSLTELHSVNLHWYFYQAYMGGRNALNNNDFRNFKIKFVAGPADTTASGIYQDSQGNNPWGYFLADTMHISVPFEFWDLGYTTSDTTDDVRIWPLMYGFYGGGRFHIDDYLIFLDKNTSGNKYTENFWSNPDHATSNSSYWNFDLGNPMSRHDWDYRFGFREMSPVWAKGDYVLVVTNKPNLTEDVFIFTAHKYTDVKDEVLANLPKTFILKQNYPNPFNPVTTIEYYLPKSAQVKISIYNILGQKVKTLVNEYQTAGARRIYWDGKDERGNSVASGIYFYKLSTSDFTESRKMLLIK